MTARYSFAVCVRCGVVSPPLIWRDDAASLPGWRFDRFRFSVNAICPACLDAEKKDSTTAA